MAFNLRGGRPKNMHQGTYWVQRARDSSRRRVTGELQVLRFNNRYSRITNQFAAVFQSYAGPGGTIEVIVGSRLNLSLDRFNDLKSWIDRNIDNATNADLSKLATSAKNVLIEIAKREGWEASWDATAKQLMLNGRGLDFS